MLPTTQEEAREQKMDHLSAPKPRIPIKRFD